MKIIGYQKAKDLLQSGRIVREVPLFKGPFVAYVGYLTGGDEFRIRSDAWDRLRRECHLLPDYTPASTSRRKVYVWAFGPKEDGHMTKTITGYFIDPAHGIAEPRTIEKSLDSYYSLLDCTCIDIVSRTIGDKRFDIITDAEALLKAPSYVSAIYRNGEPALVGSLFVCKFDGRDDVTSLTEEEQDYVDYYRETVWGVRDNHVHVYRVLTRLGN